MMCGFTDSCRQDSPFVDPDASVRRSVDRMQLDENNSSFCLLSFPEHVRHSDCAFLT